jgi:hypothetical protein
MFPIAGSAVRIRAEKQNSAGIYANLRRRALLSRTLRNTLLAKDRFVQILGIHTENSAECLPSELFQNQNLT